MKRTITCGTVAVLLIGIGAAQDFSSYGITTILSPNGPFIPLPNGYRNVLTSLQRPMPDGSGLVLAAWGFDFGLHRLDVDGKTVTLIQKITSSGNARMLNSHEYLTIDPSGFSLYTMGQDKPVWQINTGSYEWAADSQSGEIVFAVQERGIYRIPYRGRDAVPVMEDVPRDRNSVLHVAIDTQRRIYVYIDDTRHDPRASKDLWRVDRDGTRHHLLTSHGNGVDQGILTADKASLGTVSALAVDAKGNVFFAEWSTRLRVLTTDGMVIPIAGGTEQVTSGDGGPAISARFFLIESIVVDDQGFLYIQDSTDRIRKLIPPGYPVPPPPAKPVLGSAVHAATYEAGTLAPGTVFTIFGRSLSEPGLTVAQADAAGSYPRWIGQTSVSFSTNAGSTAAAPLLYVSDTQISGIVPEKAGPEQAYLTVTRSGTASDRMPIGIADVKPGLFTASSSGKGLAAALNQDGSLNGPDHPAAQRSVIVLYGTGFGMTGTAGTVAKAIEAVPLPVTATVEGKAAQVLYCGAAPGLIHGVVQINIQLPDGITPGSREIRVKVDDMTTPAGVTVFVGSN